MAVQDTRQKPLALTQSIDFFRAGNLNYNQQSLTARSVFEHVSICSPSWELDCFFKNRSPHVQFLSTHRSVRLHRKPSIIFSTLAFNGSSNGYASMGTDLLFASISTAEHRIARAILERHHARVTSQRFGPEVFFPFFFNGCLVSHGLYQAIISTAQQYPSTSNCTLHLHDHITTTIHDLNLQQ